VLRLSLDLRWEQAREPLHQVVDAPSQAVVRLSPDLRWEQQFLDLAAPNIKSASAELHLQQQNRGR